MRAVFPLFSWKMPHVTGAGEVFFVFSSSLFSLEGGKEGVGWMMGGAWCEMERWMFDRGERGKGKGWEEG